MEGSVKYMNIREFREMGLLAEVNRTFFHPLGLALEVVVDEETGEERLGGIWDCRDDPEGVLYASEAFPHEKVARAQQFIQQKHEQRKRLLGFVYQDPGQP